MRFHGLWNLLFAPEDDPSSGGGGGGGDAGREGGAGDGSSDRGSEGGDSDGSGGGGDDAPITAARMRELLEERDAQWEKRFKRVNDELKDRRHQARRGSDGGRGKEPEGDDDRRHDRRTDRRFARLLGDLEGAQVDPEVLEELEDNADELSGKDRARYVEALSRGLELGRKLAGSGSDHDEPGGDRGRSGDKRPGGRRREGNPRNTRGGEPPPRDKGSVGLPESWDEYLQMAKDPKKKAAIDEAVESGELDLTDLRAMRNKQVGRQVYRR